MEDTRKRKELRHDRHTVSLLTDHLVITPKYRGKILTGEVAFVAEAIIRATCAEMNIKIIDMAVNVDHVHIFFQYPPKYSLSYIAKKNQRKVKQDIKTGVSTPQRLVRR